MDQEEYLEEITEQWTEVHKKSMVTLLILLGLKQKSMWTKEIEQWLTDISSWEVTERGLHRTLKRMDKIGLIKHEEISAPKTGIKRKNYSLTDLGDGFLKNIETSSLKYLSNSNLKIVSS